MIPEIIFQDNYLVAINKLPGLLVHRTNIAKDASEFALQLLRDHLEMHVYPCHRLDRKTSGVLLFAKDEATNRMMHHKFSIGGVHKKYLAIVRGHTLENETIDYPLKSEKGILQSAITNYHTLDFSEIDLPYSGQSTSRYSLVEIEPQTGRMHQIRKHFAHILHPIIADRPHGCNKQNRLFKEKWDMTTMMLHAFSLSFEHPAFENRIEILASPFSEFIRTYTFLNFKNNFSNLDFIHSENN